jgi:glycerol uptake facilitator-like aquaporin
MFSDTFAGIAPSSVLPFIAAQILGGIVAAGIIKALYPGITPAAAGIIVPHHEQAGPSASQAAHDGASPPPGQPAGPVQAR